MIDSTKPNEPSRYIVITDNNLPGANEWFLMEGYTSLEHAKQTAELIVHSNNMTCGVVAVFKLEPEQIPAWWEPHRASMWGRPIGR